MCLGLKLGVEKMSKTHVVVEHFSKMAWEAAVSLDSKRRPHFRVSNLGTFLINKSCTDFLGTHIGGIKQCKLSCNLD